MNSEPNRRQWVLAALDQYERKLQRYAGRLLGSGNGGRGSDEARDVVQFVFLRLCDQSPQEIGRRLPQWLYTVCRNRSLDLLRIREKSNGHCRERPPWRSEPQPSDSPSRELNPADIAEQSDLHALLRTLIDQLPTNQREALDLWSDGFGYDQISEITNHTEGHIRVLIHRAVKTLREHPRIQPLTDSTPPPTRRASEDPQTLARSASEGESLTRRASEDQPRSTPATSAP